MPIRHALPPGAWPPEAHRLDPRWCEALSVLADLPHLTAKEWARVFELDRHRLYRLCVRSSGKPPERLVWECLHAV
ncbi:MAG TPA: hypothetical protein VFS92_07685, partial [Planctomycetota bacterium]|nr:hypothetical protein [Planctomycetota bacterium]